MSRLLPGQLYIIMFLVYLTLCMVVCAGLPCSINCVSACLLFQVMFTNYVGSFFLASNDRTYNNLAMCVLSVFYHVLTHTYYTTY
jgi:hypothetical protein